VESKQTPGFIEIRITFLFLFFMAKFRKALLHFQAGYQRSASLRFFVMREPWIHSFDFIRRFFIFIHSKH